MEPIRTLLNYAQASFYYEEFLLHGAGLKSSR